MSQLSPVTFHGDTIFCVTIENQPYAPAKPIVENLGLTWQSQAAKLSANKTRWGVTMIVIPSESGEQQTLCLPVRKLPAFLASINPKKVREDLRSKVELYQNECDDALWDYWTKGQATRVEEPKEYPSPTGIITQTQRSELKLIVDAKLSTYPATVQGKARSEVWARHNRHFRIAEYHQLPASRFDESREYLLEMQVNAVATPAPVQATHAPAHAPFDSSKLFLSRAKELGDLDQRFIQFAGEVRQQFSDFNHEFHRISDGTYAALFRDVSSVRQGSANRVVDALAVQTYDAQGWIDEGLSRMRLAVMSARSANLILADASNAKVTA